MLTLVCVSSARADVLDYIGKPVASVELVVDGRDTSDPALTKLIEVKVGEPLSMRSIRETVLHLFAMGRFDEVTVDATSQPSGSVDVRFDMTSSKPVSAIEFTGIAKAPGIDEGELRRAVTDRAGPSPPPERIDELSRVVEGALRARGYLQAKVSGHLEPKGSTHTTLVFDVDPGTRATIGTITVNGPEEARREFLTKLQKTTGAPFERDEVNKRITKYIDDRRSQGFYEAKVTLSEEPTANEVYNLTFTVDPGRHVRIVFTGDPIPGDRKDLVPVEREGSVDEDLLEDSTARIEDALKARGYKDAMAPHERMEVDGELVITFHIDRGQQYRIASASIAGNVAVPSSDLTLSPRLRVGEPFSQAAVDAEAGAIEDVYRRAGFAAAKVDVDVKTQTATSSYVPVDVTFNVREGVKSVVGTVTVTGNDSIPTATLLQGLRLQPGGPFVAASLAADRDAILVKYENLGYENATIDARREANRDGTVVNIFYAVREGPQVLVDHVLITGTRKTDPRLIEKQLQLRAGEPLSRDAVLDTQRRLQALGLYRSVTISEIRHGEDNRRDLLIVVDEGPSRSVDWGGGFELARRLVAAPDGTSTEVFDAAPRGSFQITWRNLFGTNRSTTFFSSLTLHPQGTIQAEQGVTEYRVVNTYREPKVFDTPVDGLVTLGLEQQFRTSFSFHQASATAQASRKIGIYSVVGTYQIQQTDVFNNNADIRLIDRVFPNVRLSSVALSVVRDTRNDQIDPTAGQYATANVQLAAVALGGQVGFIKSFFQVSAFRLLPGPRNIVLAGNASIGLARGFAQIDPNTGLTVDQIPQSERFYAGGDTTNRGFTLDQLGVRHFPPQINDTIDPNGFPLGGNAQSLFNLELRIPLIKNVETHPFVDTGNVFNQVADIDFREFRTAVGFGFLYKSPIGPLRFDLGFKVNKLPTEDLTAFFITFGRAF
jgi:outer membrane protein insertion porin family